MLNALPCIQDGRRMSAGPGQVAAWDPSIGCGGSLRLSRSKSPAPSLSAAEDKRREESIALTVLDRAADSMGPRGHLGPLGTASRTPWILSK